MSTDREDRGRAGSGPELLFTEVSASDTSEDCGLGHACSFCPNESHCKLDKAAHNTLLINNRLDAITLVVLVMANKGGVGKSTISANLAVALASMGYQVGLADSDIHGPNVPRIFGAQDARVKITSAGIGTHAYEGIEASGSLKLGSLGFFLEEADVPVVWRDAYKHDYVHHMIGSYDWGTLDFLVVDMPPGTGNELITITDLLEGTSVRAVLVSPADAVSLQDTLKASRFCRERGVPLLGLVENFAGVTCPHCGNEFEMFPRSKEIQRFEDDGIETLTRVPFSAEISAAAESGRPATTNLKSGITAVFENLAAACVESALTESRGLLGKDLASLMDDSADQFASDATTSQAVANIIENEKQRLSSQHESK